MDAFCLDAETCERVDELIPLFDPRLASDTIEPEFPIERKEGGRGTIDTVGPNHGDNAVREPRDRGARFRLSATRRSVSHAPISAVAREREVNACQESFEVSRALSLPLPIKHHLRKRVDVHSETAGLRLGNF